MASKVEAEAVEAEAEVGTETDAEAGGAEVQRDAEAPPAEVVAELSADEPLLPPGLGIDDDDGGGGEGDETPALQRQPAVVEPDMSSDDEGIEHASRSEAVPAGFGGGSVPRFSRRMSLLCSPERRPGSVGALPRPCEDACSVRP